MKASSWLVRLIGFPALLIHGDPLVLDRWLWLRRRLPPGDGALLDVGSGNGSFTMGAARLGYHALGLTFQRAEVDVARSRARMLGIDRATFEVDDVRTLGQRDDLVGRFDVVLCFENIEHILDDESLMRAMAATLVPGGRLLLTTPNLSYVPINRWEAGPWVPVEDGRHVRKGYTHDDVQQLAAGAGLEVVELSVCSGFLSQKLAKLQWWVARRTNTLGGWLAVLLLRPFPVMLDPVIRRLFRYPDYSVCLVARRP